MVEQAERQKLSVEQRKANLISTVWDRLMQYPEAEISYKIGNPDEKTLQYYFTNDHKERINIGCSKKSLFITKNYPNGGRASSLGVALGGSREENHYLNWEEELQYGTEAIKLIEKNINKYLPPDKN